MTNKQIERFNGDGGDVSRGRDLACLGIFPGRVPSVSASRFQRAKFETLLSGCPIVGACHDQSHRTARAAFGTMLEGVRSVPRQGRAWFPIGAATCLAHAFHTQCVVGQVAVHGQTQILLVVAAQNLKI